MDRRSNRGSERDADRDAEDVRSECNDLGTAKKAAIIQRAKWRRRLKQCQRKLKDIAKHIEILEFQEELNIKRPALPQTKIDCGTGIDWGIYWRDAEITTLKMHRVQGLGVKRIEMIQKTFRTIGEIESWRVSIGLSEIPGLTKTVARNLEESLVRWLQRYAPDYRIAPSADSLPVARPKSTKDGYLWFDD